MKKLALILILTLLVSLCACGAPAEPPASTPGVTETPDALAEPEVPDEPTLTAADITVDAVLTTYDEEFTQDMTLTATANGEVLWTYTTARGMQTQLEATEYLGVENDLVYLNVQALAPDATPGCVIALDLFTGAERWRNTDYTGASSHYVFDENHNLYLSGYFGPDCIAIAPDGATRWLHETINNYWFWPSALTYDGNRLQITFSGTQDGDATNTAFLTLDGTVEPQ